MADWLKRAKTGGYLALLCVSTYLLTKPKDLGEGIDFVLSLTGFLGAIGSGALLYKHLKRPPPPPIPVLQVNGNIPGVDTED